MYDDLSSTSPSLALRQLWEVQTTRGIADGGGWHPPTTPPGLYTAQGLDSNLIKILEIIRNRKEKRKV